MATAVKEEDSVPTAFSVSTPNAVPMSVTSMGGLLDPVAPGINNVLLNPAARGNDRPPPTVRAREFDGTIAWEEYKCHFEKVCKFNSWEERKSEYLWVQLSGSALAYAEGLPPAQTATYDLLCGALEQRFGATRLLSIYTAELNCRRRREGETLPALGQDIRRLVNHAYPDVGPRVQERFAVEKFAEALTDPELRAGVQIPELHHAGAGSPGSHGGRGLALH